MTVITEYELPAEATTLGRAALPGATVEVERLLPVEDAALGYFWLRGAGREFERELTEQPAVEDAHLAEADADTDRPLRRGRVRVADDTPLRVLVDHRADLLRCVGDDDGWELLLGVEDETAHDRLQEALAAVTDPAVDADPERRYDPSTGMAGGTDVPVAVAGPEEPDLTERQLETLVTAYRAGYFEIPRKVTLVDLADRLGVSDQAVSERLRRGEAELVRTLLSEE